MSRVAKNPVAVPAGVEVTLGTDAITVKGPLGALTQRANADVIVERAGDSLQFKAASDSIRSNAMSGTMRALLANMVQGVTKGFEKKLTLVGVGYRAQAAGDTFKPVIGFFASGCA